MALYIGIDVGGTNIKGVLIDKEGKLYGEDVVPAGRGAEIADGIAVVCNRLHKCAPEEVLGVGIGCAGAIDSESGTVVLANNLRMRDFPLKQAVEEKVNLPVKITNDANAAAYGEAKFGAAKDCKNSILVTLGTGVGGGVVIDGKLFTGNKSVGAEIGHMSIVRGGDKCTCGRRGCFEVYSSATALIKRTKWAMEEDVSSAMWGEYTSDTVTGKTAFDYADTDITANEVISWYIDHLACGIVNLANIFRPEIILLGGGVSGQGERLTLPLQKILDRELFASRYAPVKLGIAKLGAAAGAYGAAALFFEE